MIKWVAFIFLGLLNVSCCHAADLPKSVQTPEEVRHCIQASTKDCIRAACIAGAPQNCRTQCRQNAIKKCRALTKQIHFRLQHRATTPNP